LVSYSIGWKSLGVTDCRWLVAELRTNMGQSKRIGLGTWAVMVDSFLPLSTDPPTQEPQDLPDTFSGRSYDPYTYQNGGWSGTSPVLQLGEAFWCSKSIPAVWYQNKPIF